MPSPAPDPGPAPFPRRFGDYELLAEIGRGANGVVYRARQLSLPRLVAVKVALAGPHAGTHERRRFRGEAEAAARLCHPGIVRIHEVGSVEGQAYFSMDLVSGPSLRERIAHGPLPAEAAARLVAAVADAVHHAHEHGVIHRDLKPGNILLAGDGQPRVTDFGLAKSIEDPAQLTAAGDLLGTPSYMSPEQAGGATERIGRATDVYGLGGVLYALLTGRPPFVAKGAAAIVQQVLRHDPIPVRVLSPEVDRDLETICHRCLHKDPPRRYATAAAVRDDLGRWLRHDPIVARPVGRTERLYLACRRAPATAALAAVVVLVVAIGGSLVIAQWRSAVRALAHAEASQRAQLRALVEALEGAAPEAVPLVLDELAELGEPARAALRARLPLSPSAQRIRLALLAGSPELAEPLAERLLAEARPGELLLLLRSGLVPVMGSISAAAARRITAGLEQGLAAGGGGALRAAAALLLLDPERAAGTGAAAIAARELTHVNPLHLETWVAMLAPAGAALRAELAATLRGGGGGAARQLAATILTRYAAEQPELLASLLQDLEPAVARVLLVRLAELREQAVPLLTAALAGTVSDAATPVAAAAAALDPALAHTLARAAGMATASWAFCQQLPLDELAGLAERMHRLAYRPTRVRPYSSADGTRVAVLWVCDGLPYRLALALTEAELRERQATLAREGFVPIDVAGYLAGAEDRPRGIAYVALWTQGTATTRLTLGEDPGSQERLTKELGAQGLTAQTCQALLDDSGTLRIASSWVQEQGAPAPFFCAHGVPGPALAAGFFPGRCAIDLQVHAMPPLDPRARFHSELEQAEAGLAADPRDAGALLRRARARFALGQDRQALADFAQRIASGPPAPELHFARAVLHACLDEPDEARQEADAFARLGGDPALLLALRAVLALGGASERRALGRIEAELDRSDDPDRLFLAAVFHALASRRLAGSERAGEHAKAAVDRLERAMALGWANTQALHDSPWLDPIRGLPAFASAVQATGLHVGCAGVWRSGPRPKACISQGLAPRAHLERCRELAAQGFWPVAVSAVAASPGAVSTASLWHRPAPADEARALAVQRRSRIAAALLHLGAAEPVWPLLGGTAEPGLRAAVVAAAAELVTTAAPLLQRLRVEPDAAARATLLLLLARAGPELVASAGGPELPRELLRLHGQDPDPGVHAAAATLLRALGHAAPLAAATEALAGQPGPGGWYVDGQGLTMVVVPGPAELWMGSPGDEPLRETSEELHRRRIERGFAISATEVTQALFQRFLHDYPERDPGGAGVQADLPATAVDWFQAAAFCRWLSEKEGVPEAEMCYPPVAEITAPVRLPADWLQRTGYRLPTEAEWELACRAGSLDSRFFGSDARLLDQFAVWRGNAADAVAPVASRMPNPLGLFDMLGNAWEWCHTRFDDYLLPRDGRPLVDAVDARPVGEQDWLVLRGGSFFDGERAQRCAGRRRYLASATSLSVGFRVARTRR